jgi:hypothetical protein
MHISITSWHNRCTPPEKNHLQKLPVGQLPIFYNIKATAQSKDGLQTRLHIQPFAAFTR